MALTVHLGMVVAVLAPTQAVQTDPFAIPQSLAHQDGSATHPARQKVSAVELAQISADGVIAMMTLLSFWLSLTLRSKRQQWTNLVFSLQAILMALCSCTSWRQIPARRMSLQLWLQLQGCRTTALTVVLQTLT